MTSEGRAGLWSPRARTCLLVAGQLIFVLVLGTASRSWSQGGTDAGTFALVAGLFAIGGLLVFHLEFRDEAHSFTLSEVPLVVGLFHLAPGALFLARLVGEAIALIFHPRQPPLKLVVNLTSFMTECAVAVAVFYGVFSAPGLDEPIGWVAAIIAVLAADLVGVIGIAAVITWHGGDPDLQRVGVAAAGSAVANASLGVIAVLLAEVHIASLAVLGVVAAVVFTAYRAYARLTDRFASLQVLHDFSEAIGGVVRPDDVVEAMLHHARRLLRADVAELVLAGAVGEPLRVRLEGNAPLRHVPFEDAAREAASLPAGHVVLNPRGDAVVPHLRAYVASLGRQDSMVVRLELAEVNCSLAVAGRLAEVSTFEAEDAKLFATLASHAAMALEKGRLIDKLRAEAERREHQALHDDLTGLPNRAHFNEACAQALANLSSGETVAVLLLDLDQFKEINDTLGHQTGDELLIELGQRIDETVRKPNIAARLGGDEFAVLLTGLSSGREAVAGARGLLDALHAPMRLQEIDFEVRGSIGVALAPDHGKDAHGLLQRADVAMYAAKRSGTGIELYSSAADHHSPRRLQIAGELAQAIRDGEVVAHFQPKADLRTQRIVGAEALARWQHPTLGRVRPDEFISIAEQTGVITPLTTLILRQAATACARWRRSGHDVDVAVNVSARSLLESGFAEEVQAIIEQVGLPPHALTLELTESSVMSDTSRSLGVLERLAVHGVRLSIDDFGTGYSSLSYLQRLPMHELKVDRSFVIDVSRDTNAQAIIRSVVELGHSLGLKIVAEGVENRLAWDHLIALGCDVGQGYFLSRPIPEDELLGWLDHRARAIGADDEVLALD